MSRSSHVMNVSASTLRPTSGTKGRYRAGIIGLGMIGNQFDEDPKRMVVWTHAGAYMAVPDLELIAGADPDQKRLHQFLERRGVPSGYRDYREMLRGEAIDLLSICSPTQLHYEMVLEGVRAGVKAIFCEKPIATTVDQAVEMVEACAAAGVLLAVNHTRRWESIYIHAKGLLDHGLIGRIESVVGYYPGKVFTMGTHLFDLMRYFAGEVEWVSGVEVGPAASEPHLSGHLRFRSGAQGAIIAGWDRANHIFELEFLGSRGRLRVAGDGTQLEVYTFQDSPRYSGYRELTQVDQHNDAAPSVDAKSFGKGRASERVGRAGEISSGVHIEENRLIAAVQDLVRCVDTGTAPACTGIDGLAALEIACGLLESAQVGSRRVLLAQRDSRKLGQVDDHSLTLLHRAETGTEG